jgi:HptB-dependent secretion and biofilm anti anti-sigma factor
MSAGTIKVTSSEDEMTLTITGDFNRSMVVPFQETFKSQAKKQRYVVDLKGTQFIDSSAIGALMVLREYAGEGDADITLAHANEDIMYLLTLVKMEYLFTIE